MEEPNAHLPRGTKNLASPKHLRASPLATSIMDSQPGLVQRRTAPAAPGERTSYLSRANAGDLDGEAPIVTISRPPPTRRIARPVRGKNGDAVDRELQETVQQACIGLFIIGVLLGGAVALAFFLNGRIVLDKLIREELELRAQLERSYPGKDIEKMVDDAPKYAAKHYRPGLAPPGGGNYEDGWFGALPPQQLQAAKLRAVRRKLGEERKRMIEKHGAADVERMETGYRESWTKEIQEREERFRGDNGAAGRAPGSKTPKQSSSSGVTAEDVERLRAELEKLKAELEKAREAAGQNPQGG